MAAAAAGPPRPLLQGGGTWMVLLYLLVALPSGSDGGAPAAGGGVVPPPPGRDYAQEVANMAAANRSGEYIVHDDWQQGSRTPRWFFTVIILASFVCVAGPLAWYISRDQWRLYVVMYLIVLLALFIVGELTWYIGYISSRKVIVDKIGDTIDMVGYIWQSVFTDELETGVQIVELLQAAVRGGSLQLRNDWPGSHIMLMGYIANLATDSLTAVSVYYGVPGNRDPRADGGPSLVGLQKERVVDNVWQVWRQGDSTSPEVPFVTCDAVDRVSMSPSLSPSPPTPGRTTSIPPPTGATCPGSIAAREAECGRNYTFDLLCQRTCAGEACTGYAACDSHTPRGRLPSTASRFCHFAPGGHETRLLARFPAYFDVRNSTQFAPDPTEGTIPYPPSRVLQYNPLERAWWTEASVPKWTPPYTFTKGGVGITISVGAYNADNAFAGSVAVDFTMSSFQDLISRLAPSGGSVMYMIAAGGIAFASSVGKEALWRDTEDPAYLERLAQRRGVEKDTLEPPPDWVLWDVTQIANPSSRLRGTLDTALGSVGGEFPRLFFETVKADTSGSSGGGDSVLSLPIQATYGGYYFLLIRVPYEDIMGEVDRAALVSLSVVLCLSVVAAGIFVYVLRRTFGQISNDAAELDLDTIMEDNDSSSALTTLSRCKEVSEFQKSLRKFREQLWARRWTGTGPADGKESKLERTMARISNQAARRVSRSARSAIDPNDSLSDEDMNNLGRVALEAARRASGESTEVDTTNFAATLTEEEMASVMRAAALADNAAAQHLSPEEQQLLRVVVQIAKSRAATAYAARVNGGGDAANGGHGTEAGGGLGGGITTEEVQVLQDLALHAAERALGQHELAALQAFAVKMGVSPGGAGWFSEPPPPSSPFAHATTASSHATNATPSRSPEPRVWGDGVEAGQHQDRDQHQHSSPSANGGGQGDVAVEANGARPRTGAVRDAPAQHMANPLMALATAGAAASPHLQHVAGLTEADIHALQKVGVLAASRLGKSERARQQRAHPLTEPEVRAVQHVAVLAARLVAPGTEVGAPTHTHMRAPRRKGAQPQPPRDLLAALTHRRGVVGRTRVDVAAACAARRGGAGPGGDVSSAPPPTTTPQLEAAGVVHALGVIVDAAARTAGSVLGVLGASAALAWTAPSRVQMTVHALGYARLVAGGLREAGRGASPAPMEADHSLDLHSRTGLASSRIVYGPIARRGRRCYATAIGPAVDLADALTDACTHMGAGALYASWEEGAWRPVLTMESVKAMVRPVMTVRGRGLEDVLWKVRRGGGGEGAADASAPERMDAPASLAEGREEPVVASAAARLVVYEARGIPDSDVGGGGVDGNPLGVFLRRLIPSHPTFPWSVGYWDAFRSRKAAVIARAAAAAPEDHVLQVVARRLAVGGDAAATTAAAASAATGNGPTTEAEGGKSVVGADADADAAVAVDDLPAPTRTAMEERIKTLTAALMDSESLVQELLRANGTAVTTAAGDAAAAAAVTTTLAAASTAVPADSPDRRPSLPEVPPPQDVLERLESARNSPAVGVIVGDSDGGGTAALGTGGNANPVLGAPAAASVVGSPALTAPDDAAGACSPDVHDGGGGGDGGDGDVLEAAAEVAAPAAAAATAAAGGAVDAAPMPLPPVGTAQRDEKAAEGGEAATRGRPQDGSNGPSPRGAGAVGMGGSGFAALEPQARTQEEEERGSSDSSVGEQHGDGGTAAAAPVHVDVNEDLASGVSEGSASTPVGSPVLAAAADAVFVSS